MTSIEIEIAVADFFGVRQHLIVPNVSWGLGIHECDLLIITKAGFANEVEIKINRYDLKKDQKKWHGHRNNLIKRLFFAIPESLAEFKEYIPERAGIFLVKENLNQFICNLIKPAQINKNSKPLNTDQIIHLGKLASMRMWSLKKNILYRKEEVIII